jgi:cellulose biosynthesis protein BcsQ/tetratricopeptide (TPR) repeat protein
MTEAVMGDAAGQIVTFYSYKGGTGRTMAVANIAWILASRGKRVLTVDWDLESPGLHKFFRPFLDEAAIKDTPGIIEIVNEYAWAATDPQPRADDWHLDYAQVLRHAVSLSWDEPPVAGALFPGEGTLDFISAGRQNRDYSTAVTSMDWDNFYERLGGGRFLRAMRDDMKRNYDYVLIDSRTGVSDVADICTVEFPDTLVVCFTLNDQSIDGASAVARHISRRYSARNIRILPVPMRTENGEKEKLDVGRALARIKFDGFPDGSAADQVAQYWGSVEVPYQPFYAFEETLATFGDDPAATTSLLAAYERLTSVITNGAVTGMPALPDGVRLAYREEVTRRPLAPTSDVLLSYAPEDRMWADWIEAVLNRAGYRVVPQSTLATPAAGREPRDTQLRPGSRTVSVLSWPYMTSEEAKALWQAAAAADQLLTRPQLVPVKVSDTRLIAPFSERSPVDLVRASAEQATAALLRAFDRPVPPQLRGPQPDLPRFPGTVPPIWSVPSRNADFTGRGGTLEKVRDRLTGSGMAVVLAQALYGLGGVGKTQVALEYAHRFMADYDLVWWISAERLQEVSAALSELAGQLGLPVSENVAEAAAAALEALRRDSTRRWLLIYDNAEDPKDLEQFLPVLPANNGHVIITSRNQAWGHSAEPLEVDVFTREESVTHLLHHVDISETDAASVAAALGDLPLAIEQAGAWLEETGMPAAQYVAQLDGEGTRILALNPPADYPVSAVATWNLSIERLKQQSPAAERLLQLCACFSPGPIAMDLLYSDEMISSLLPFEPALTEKLILGQVIRDISRYALVKVDQSSRSLSIHRLVQAVIRDQMTADEVEKTCHEVHDVLAGARPRQGDTDDPENWPRYRLLWPHLVPSRAEECTEPTTRQLLIDWVRYLWKHGEFEDALGLGERLRERWIRDLGEDHQQTLFLQFHMANVLRSQGRLAEALELDSYVLDRQQETLGPRHLHVLMTAGGRAADLRGLGQYQQALDSDKETYERFKDMLGDDNPRTLAAANNLAVSYRMVGDCFTARQIDGETLTRRQGVLGADHPYTLYSMANLARDLREAGAFGESVDLLRSTYSRYQEVLGDELMDTLRTGKSLAVSLRKAGAHADARALTEQTYERYLRLYGPENLDRLACALNLACDCSATGDKLRAAVLAQEVMAACASSLGEDHPYTLVAANNLATYLRGTGQLDEARALAEQTLDGMRTRLGEDHPFTLSCSINLANCLGEDGDPEAAETLLREAISKLRATLGPLHPDTLVGEADLAITLREAGKQAEAGHIRDRLLEDLSRVLGEGHPNVGLLRTWERISRDLEPQPT